MCALDISRQLDVTRYMGDIVVPHVLQESFNRHQENVLTLVAALQAAGLDDVDIEAGVSAVIESYKIELGQAIKSCLEI